MERLQETVHCMIIQKKKEDKPSEEVSVRYYISSEDMDAREFAYAVSSHWKIEDILH